MPWIHLADLRAAIVHAVVSETLTGPVNCTAPAPGAQPRFHPQTRRRRCIARRFCPCPRFALKLALGDFGGALLASQRALPAALEADGFQFRFPTLEAALGDLTAS